MSGGGLQQEQEVPQEGAEAGDGVLAVDGLLSGTGDADGVADHEELVAPVVVGRVHLAGGGTELAGGLDGAGGVAHHEGGVVGLQHVGVLGEELGQDVVALVAVHGDQLGVLESDRGECREDEPVGELGLGGRRLLVLAGVGADQLVLVEAHGAVTDGQQDLSDVVGVDLLCDGEPAKLPVGDAAGDDHRVDPLRGVDRGVDERPVDGVHGVGAGQPVGTDLVGVGADQLLGERCVVLERLARRGHADQFLERLHGGSVRKRVAEGLRDLDQDSVADRADQPGVFVDLAEVVATEVHEFPLLGDVIVCLNVRFEKLY